MEAIKKQQNEIDELKQAKTVQTRSVIGEDEDKQSDMNSLMDERLKAKLYSNIPNPFKERTTILFSSLKRLMGPAFIFIICRENK